VSVEAGATGKTAPRASEEDGDHAYRESIVKKSTREIVYRSERQDHRGAWFVNLEDTCKK
jgi:hypothetical protein